ncbi:MAG: hypothetical protein PF588_04445 [Candidatus Kapabacteria bacterium]|jgi:hypothetical protein|nr:hypothetical protein [Candidatus Kapabacteria bacterium]
MSINKRGTVEIYFILYLAAIIFLLPDRQDSGELNDDRDGTMLVQSPFSLHPVKSNLTCTLRRDSLGLTIVSLDSMNTILYDGKVENVRLEFFIVDPQNKKELRLNADNNSDRYFRYEQNLSQHAARFLWTPPIHEKVNKTYHIKVKASAFLIDKPKSADSSESGELYAETEFNVQMIFLDNTGDYLGPDGIVYSGSGSESGNYQPGDPRFVNSRIPLYDGNIDMQAIKPSVRTIAYQKWENRIMVFNAMPSRDLEKNPEVRVVNKPGNNEGTAALFKISGNEIILSGRTPAFGEMKVKVIARFKNDTKEYSVDFRVSPIPIQEPEYERMQYPEKTYDINPNMPFIMGQETRAEIKDGFRVLATSEQGGKFSFSPKISDTNKVLTLECYIDGNLYGQRHEIRVLSYPAPVIDNMQNTGSKVKPEIKIISKCYGVYNNKNNAVRLEVQGNCEVFEPRGRIPESKDEIIHIQIFRLTPIDPEKPFEFKVRAIDKRNKKSEFKTYKQN